MNAKNSLIKFQQHFFNCLNNSLITHFINLCTNKIHEPDYHYHVLPLLSLQASIVYIVSLTQFTNSINEVVAISNAQILVSPHSK